VANIGRIDIRTVISTEDSKSLGYVVSMFLTAKGDPIPGDSLPTHPAELF
jgi:hypothetical protein